MPCYGLLEEVTGKPYSQHNNFDELEKDVRRCLTLLQELPNRIRYNTNQYRTLQRFFHALEVKADEWTYAYDCCEVLGPYTVPLGW